MIYTIFILIAFAAMCNAVMDTIKHHWGESIFARKLVVGGKAHDFFHKLGWRNSYVNGDPKQGKVKWKVFGISFTPHPAFLDAWHAGKSTMLVCLLTSIALTSFARPGEWWEYVILTGLLGLDWILVFNVFYNKIFKA